MLRGPRDDAGQLEKARMSLNRYAKRRDETEPQIVLDLRRCGYLVWLQDFPDLAVRRSSWTPGLVRWLEVEGITLNRRRSQAQLEFIREWGIPIVRNSLEALDALDSSDPKPHTSRLCTSKPLSVAT